MSGEKISHTSRLITREIHTFSQGRFISPLPPDSPLAKAGYTERRKTQREIRMVDIPAVIAAGRVGGGGGGEVGVELRPKKIKAKNVGLF